MEPTVFQPEPYLARLGLAAPPPATEAGLETLHRAQAYTIPFENFDILLGRGVSLAPGAIFDKLVRHPRGGYCFELNGLLLMALAAFGFTARPLLARVHLSGRPSGRGHQLLLVRIGDREWLADVGFGGPGLRAPIPIEPDRVARQDGIDFRLVDAGVFGTLLQRRRGDNWQDLYSFDRAHVEPADIVYGNHFTSTHPGSFFTFSRVAALPRPDGRASLLDRKLSLESPAGEDERELPAGQAYLEALRTHFGIELDAPIEALPPLRQAAGARPTR